MRLLPILAASLIAAASARAADMPGMAMSGDASASSQAFKAANERMMQGMGGTPTGDADRDFVAAMIPHHQGAIDMAQVELKYGHDTKLRRMARDIVAAQQREIAEMKAWQARR